MGSGEPRFLLREDDEDDSVDTGAAFAAVGTNELVLCPYG